MTLISSISGIRGTIGGQPGHALTPPDIVRFTSAFGLWVRQTTQNPHVVIGRDARPSGLMVSSLVSGALQSVGIHVTDLGLSTTPTVEMAVVAEQAGGGIIITASHNPVQWNALKLLNQYGEFISDAEGEAVLQLAGHPLEYAEVKQLGTYRTDDTYLQKHISAILALPLVDKKAIEKKNFRIALDCVNSTGGIAVPMLLEALGVRQIEKFFCEPDGHFPHNPEPLPEHLTFLCNEMERGNYHLGIAVDPDVDRLAFVREDGTPFGEEYTLVAVADYVLKHAKEGEKNTVSNLSSTRALHDVTKKAGGQHYAAAVGEVNVVALMKEVNAVVGGEGNGGVIYPPLHYGRDALVGIALFLTHLAKYGKTASMLRGSYPNYYISKNKIELTPEIDVDHVLHAIKEKYHKQPINDIDGVKIDFDEQWVHLRRSNTEPIIRIYSESPTMATAEALANKLISDIKEIITEKA